MTGRTWITLFACICTMTAGLAGQVTRPGSWRVVPDRPGGDSTIFYVAMPPGWHVSTGPGSLFFDPAFHAEGRFGLEAEVYVFPGRSEEGYGLFLGGRDLGSGHSSWSALLLSRNGTAAVVRIEGTTLTMLCPWRRLEGLLAPGDGQHPVKNVLRVSAEDGEVDFQVNGVSLGKLPRPSVMPDGDFGLRVGEGLNLHVARLDLVRPLAPAAQN